MKRLKFLETKRTPRYSLRKLNVGVASVLLGVTIFGINFTNHSVKAATKESVETSNSSPNSNSQQTLAAVLTTAGQTKGINAIGAVKVPDSQNDANKAIDDALNKKNSGINGATNIDQTTKDKLIKDATDAADKAKDAINKATTNNDVATEQTDTQKAASATGKVQQSSVSNNATANNSTEAATTLQSAPKTQGSAGSGVSGSSATEVVSGSQASNSQAASATSSVATASQATPATQVTASANHTAIGTTPSSQTVSLDEATSPAVQAQTLMTNLAVRNSNTADALPKSTQTYALFSQPLLTDYHTASGTNTTPSSQTVSLDEATSSAVQARILMTNLAVKNSNTADALPKSTQTYTLVSQPLLSDYLNDGNKDNTWVYKTIKLYKDSTLDTIFNTTPKRTFWGNTIPKGIIPSNPHKYFFAAYVDYSTSLHRVILLARSQHPKDHNLYTYVIHTGSQDTSPSIVARDAYTQEFKSGVTGSKYNLILKNYQGKSYTVSLEGFKDGDWGLLPVFEGGLLDPTYGSNTYDQNDKAAETESISLLAGMIPQETSTKVRYVDQATGKDILQPMEISGFGYQGFQVKGKAPNVPGYSLVSEPKFLGLKYEDGTIAPYKVGQTYDLALSDNVVIKQTVIDTDGTVRATAYYNGTPLLTSASKVLGRESYNNKMSFITSDGKGYTYTNPISQVDDSYIYYYAKDGDPNRADMRLHFIDVTGVNNSYYAPSDGPELDADKKTIHGNIGDNYSFAYKVPTNYYEVGSKDVTGTYSGTHHDAYVYVKKENKLYAPVASDPLTVEQGTTLTTDQAKATVKYNGDVPSDATYAWDPKTPVDTATVGSYKTNVIVTYGDGTISPVPVTVNVVAKTDK
ncbi:Rib/alpha-like domain-containing protein, partial [Lactobacillus gallinarum]|uniref:Rib/alpha-like domain-containing protein n=1 Tax=Lactobacillus gallinarum TaxID=52242 RepID=UPI0025A4C8E0